MAKSLTTGRPHADKSMATTLHAEKAELKTLANAVHAISDISFARVGGDFNRLRKDPHDASLTQLLTADIARLKTEIVSSDARLATVSTSDGDATLDESGIVPQPQALAAAVNSTFAPGLAVAQSDLDTLAKQLGS
jgi:hypothetical protein